MSPAKKSIIFNVFVWVVGLCVVGNSYADGFFLEGEVFSEDRIPLAKGVSSNAVTRFQIDFDEGNWRIQTERKGHKLTRRFDVGSSNSVIYSITHHRSNESTNWSIAGASVRPGPVPFVLGDPMVQVLWIAFVSQTQYKKDGWQILPRVFFPYSPDLNNANFGLPMDVSRSDKPPFFLSKLILFTDGIWRYWEEERDSWVRPPLEKPFPYPYQNGCTNSIYQVIDFDTDGSATWPSRFQFVSYRMKSEAVNSNDLAIVCTMDGRVTKHASSPRSASFLPQIPPGSPVNDERFIWDESPVFSFIYLSPGKWLTKDEAIATAEYKNQAQRQHAQKPLIESRPRKQSSENEKTKASRARVVLIILAGISFIPIFFLIRGRGRSGKQATTTQ